MFEQLGFENLTAPEVSIWFGLALGVAFGALAEVTRFCFRRAVAGPVAERRSALGVWLVAVVAALIGTQAAVSAGLIAFDDHRFMVADLPALAIVIGGLLFGAGMVLTRGCVSRLTVLTGSGNLRALLVLVVFAIVAHATLKGVLAPIRVALGGATVSLGDTVALSALPGGAWIWTAILAIPALLVAARSGASRVTLALAVPLGLLAAAGWVGTGYVLFDDFDPVALESLSFTSPAADTLFWGVASTSIPARFGVGLIGGVLAGALVASVLGRRFQWQSFESPAQTGRYMAGAVLMGVGGVLAGGCTVGAGLSGIPTLSVAALLAIVAIAAGGVLTDRVLIPSRDGYAGSSAKRPAQPAE
ncbi:YeeE/YedE family protein [Actibacterium lipolyticum]|uniref:Putative inner membrane protein n=1 Tax=Actibacterium lipolyticum TaxID=1524263 RepID=A0A238JTM2_9RHOB|nr:YeeE/YedE family protein [Actibacterium lipolyticum]SMX34001.1 putative inner membrane protein [Actibacterium lipolyticum]